MISSTKIFKYVVIEGCPDDYLEENGDEGYYFRITKNNPPETSDFIPQYMDSFYKRRKDDCNKKKDKKCLCMMCGLSLFKKKEEAILMMKRYPKMGNYLFRGYIKAEYGVIKASPNKENPSHHTWYPFDKINERDIFVDLATDEEENDI